jgi:phospholipid/cholesterol/gamma-HCH transport system substrate-binding protein
MSGSAVVRRRLQGLAFLVVLALLLGLAVAQYRQAFSGAVRVTLETDTIGNQLQEASDVKIRGVLVGQVRSVSADADGASIELAIDSDHLADIPADVSARLLPKTLFGERFVSLVPPEAPNGQTLDEGDVIGQDRSENAIELQQVVDDLLPLLQAVSPQDLSYTLGAVADALRGRGDRLGENLASLGTYVGEVNTVLPQLQADISRIADVSDTYDSAADDLLAVLDNLSVTSTTLVDQSEQLRRTFTVVDASSATAADFLTRNEDSLISLAASSRPVLGLLAEYSPEYPCLLDGLATYKPLIAEAFGADGDPALNLNITVQFPPRNPYAPGDQPAYIDTSGPSCGGLDDIDGIIAAAQNGSYYCPEPPADGIDSPEDTVNGPRCLNGTPGEAAPAQSTSGGTLGNSLPVALNDGGTSGGLAGSTAELDFVRGLLGYQTGVDPADVSDLAASQLAPVLRGTSVVIP